MSYFLTIENDKIIGASECVSGGGFIDVPVSEEMYNRYDIEQKKYGKNILYIYDNGQIIVNPNYEEEKEEIEAKKIAMLSITKYDFYKLICQPNDLDYQQVITLVNSNDDIAAAWNFCERIYRGDELLNTYIKQFIPTITDEMLDEIFITYGK